MKESVPDIMERTPRPRTMEGLAEDLRNLGVPHGATLIVHSSLSSLGWVVGGAQSAIGSLMSVIGTDGTLVMPTFSLETSDPTEWAFQIPQQWFPEIRDAVPPFDKDRTPTGMGRIPELFRTWPDVYRSNHPQGSFAAWGQLAEDITGEHPLAWPLSDNGPLGRVYDHDGWILLLGVGHESNTSLHLAEGRSKHPRVRVSTLPILDSDGQRKWQSVPDVAHDGGLFFPAIGEDFERSGTTRVGLVGSAESRLLHQRELVDFATGWFDASSGSSHIVPPEGT